MEFLVGSDVSIPHDAPESEVNERLCAEATAAAGLAREGQLVRLWTRSAASGASKAVGLYRAGSEAELDDLLGALPLNGWMQITVAPLEPHPNDPTSSRRSSFQLPVPRLTPVYRLEATPGEAVDLGDTAHGHRRIVQYVQSRGVRHGSSEVLARLGRGEDVDASEYTFRTSTQIETVAPRLDCLDKGVFVSVGGRQPSAVAYETYLVQ